MKKKYITLLSAILIGTSAPMVAFADDIDNQINNSNNQIETLKGQKQAAEATLAQLDIEILELDSQVKVTLDKKIALEKELNKLDEEITKLVIAIEKRTDKISEQARATQVNNTSNRFLDVVLDSENISDAITRTLAYGKLVQANNEIVVAQKQDQEALAQKITEVDTKITEVNALTVELQKKQETVETKRYDQAILAKEVAANLTEEEGKKADLLREKEEAEKRKVEAARLLSEKKAKEEAIRAEAEANNLNSGLPTPTQPSPGTGNGGGSTGGSINKPQTGTGDFKWPLPSIVITSGFGSRPDPTGNAGNYHSGLDMAGSLNDNVYASAAGTVVSSSFEPGGGNHIIIKHPNGYYTYYLHLNKHVASVGQEVQAGDVVGLMGTTGDSTGVHLHFGISTGFWSGYLNPGPFLGL